jgi:hypothetical protein
MRTIHVRGQKGAAMDRRKFLTYSSAGLLASGLGSGSSALGNSIVPGTRLKDNDDGLISWDQFIDEAVPAGQKLADDRSQAGQDAYLYALGSLAARLGELPEAETRDFGDLTPAYELNMIFRESDSPFFILFWKMEPGAIFPAHCHPGANVCTLCTNGRAIIRNFDTADGAPKCWEDTEDRFGVVETKSEILRPGVVNTVTEFRNNIHRFEAGPEGVAGIDITTGYDDKPKPFSFLKLDDRKSGPYGEIDYSGQWVGKDIKRAV